MNNIFVNCGSILRFKNILTADLIETFEGFKYDKVTQALYVASIFKGVLAEKGISDISDDEVLGYFFKPEDVKQYKDQMLAKMDTWKEEK